MDYISAEQYEALVDKLGKELADKIVSYVGDQDYTFHDLSQAHVRKLRKEILCGHTTVGQLLLSAFTWSRTPEGRSFWADISDRHWDTEI